MTKTRIVTLFLLVSVGFGMITGVAAADVHEVDVETTYNGGEEDTDQRIETTVTLSPESSTLTDIEINFVERDAVIDDGSFEQSVDPDVQLTETGPGRYEIDELDPGEEVVISFVAYPQDIKSEEVTVAEANFDFFGGGQSAEEQITADTSSSPWFQLQEARTTIEDQEEEISSQQSTIDRLNLADQLTSATFVVGLVVGILGIAIAVYSSRKRSAEVNELKHKHADLIESEAEGLTKEGDRLDMEDVADDIRPDDGPDPGPDGPSIDP